MWLIQPIASEEDYQNLLTICAFIILFFCGLILLIFTFKFNIHAQAKKAWLFIAIATFSWAFGELTTILSELVLQGEGQIIGDLFRLIGYPIFFLGLIMQWRILEVQVKKLEVVIFLALFIICLSLVLTMLNIPILSFDSDTLSETVLTAVFPTMDLVLTFISGIILWKVKRRKLIFPWIILTLLLVNNMVINWQSLEI